MKQSLQQRQLTSHVFYKRVETLKLTGFASFADSGSFAIVAVNCTTRADFSVHQSKLGVNNKRIIKVFNKLKDNCEEGTQGNICIRQTAKDMYLLKPVMCNVKCNVCFGIVGRTF